MGRPKGSKNKRSVGIPPELSEALGHRDPADVLGEIYSMPFDDLKRLVRSKAGAQAMALRLAAARDAMPYRHSKMPVLEIVAPANLPVLQIVANTNTIEEKQRLINDRAKAVSLPVVSPIGQAIDAKGKTDE